MSCRMPTSVGSLVFFSDLADPELRRATFFATPTFNEVTEAMDQACL